jgi:biotin carboxylase
MTDASKTVRVIGLEPFNRALLERMPGAEEVRFRGLLDYAEVVRPPADGIDFTGLLAAAARRLAESGTPTDGVIWYWDFPSSALGAVLAHRLGLPGPPLEAVAACQHKVWSRIEQARAAPDLVPRFAAIDPFAADPLAGVDLAFPFWIKPVKAHSSYLGFRIHDRAELDAALPAIRAGIATLGRPFDQFLSLVERPAEVRAIGGHHCIAEEIISEGRQCTLEGWAFGGEVAVYGVVDSIREGRHHSCFQRYQYPSALPEPVRARMIEGAARVVRRIGYEGAPFNAEFYWDPETDRVRLLEINARLSKSHAPLFEMVEGSTHQKVAVDLALGRRPEMPTGQGAFPLAAKVMLRHFEDGVVRRVPGTAEIARLRARFPEALVRVLAKEGQALRHMPLQDSYSYELAELFIGAEGPEDLDRRIAEAREILRFEIAPEPSAA